MEKQPISSAADIKLLVDTFYRKVQIDGLIGPIFHQVVQNRWDEHLPKMYRFWESVLLDNPVYNGRPFPPHMHLPIDHAHFERWLHLFEATLTELFSGPQADKALAQAQRMALLFESKITFLRENQKPTNLMDYTE